MSCILLAVLLGAAANDVPRRSLPLNECGAPVRDEAGRPVLYSREQLAAMRCAAPAATSSVAPIGRLLRRAQRARWAFASFGSMVGTSDVVVSDVPPSVGSGPAEIYLGGSSSIFGANDYWHALRYSTARQAYDDVFVSERLPAQIARLGVADIRGDARRELVVALTSGQILVYDQVSKLPLLSFSTGLAGLRGLALRDLGGDGKSELIVTNEPASGTPTLRVFTGSGGLGWQVPGVGGRDVVVGQMDADPSLEIAVTGGSVVDAASRAVQWTWPAGFGKDVEAADIDGDGMQELIAAEQWDFVWAYDVDTQLPKWSLPVDLDVSAIHVANVDADPTPELLVSQYQQGKLDVYDTVTQALEWSVTTEDAGISPVALGDVDGDAGVEIVFGSGFASTGADHLYVADLATHAVEWQSVALDGPFVGPEYGDVDGDGSPELVFASTSSNSGYDSGRVVVLDGSTFAVRGISPESGLEGWTGLHDLKLRNVDGDAALEIVVATDHLYDGLIRIYDFEGATNSFAEHWTNAEMPFGSPFYSVEVADLDADGSLEVIGGGGREHTGAEGVFVYVFDLNSGLREWRTFQLGGYWSHITQVMVLDGGGGHPDLVARVGDGAIYVFDGVTRAPTQIINGAFSAAGDASSPPGRAFLAAAATGGLVHRYERGGSTYGLASTLTLAPSRIDGVHFFAEDGLVAAGQDGVVSAYHWGGPAVWRTVPFGTSLGSSLADGPQYWYSGAGHAVAAFTRPVPRPRPAGVDGPPSRGRTTVLED
jgi:hypothetical protein